VLSSVAIAVSPFLLLGGAVAKCAGIYQERYNPKIHPLIMLLHFRLRYNDNTTIQQPAMVSRRPASAAKSAAMLRVRAVRASQPGRIKTFVTEEKVVFG